MDNQETNLIYGKNAVTETLNSGREIDTVYIQKGAALSKIVALAKKNGVVIKEVSDERLTAICGTPKHGGTAAELAAASYSTVEDILANAEQRGKPPFIIIADEIEDPHNLGAIIRTAEAAGADIVGDDELIARIAGGFMDFDVVVTTPDMMGRVGRLGKVLGPRGLMPNPKAGTVTMDVTKAINDIKAGKIEYRLDKTNIIHVPVGKVSFGSEKLAENFQTLMSAIIKAKPQAAKGQYMKSVVLTTTMGPGVKVNPAKISE